MMNKHFADHTYDDDYYMIGRPETILITVYMYLCIFIQSNYLIINIIIIIILVIWKYNYI